MRPGTTVRKEKKMKLTALLLLQAIAFMPLQAEALQDNAVQTLTEELKAHTPAKWEVRVRWRDGQLLASITPWPYQAAFDLWYDTAKLADTLTRLCPKPDEDIWKLIKPDQDVILEPTVGGKSGADARVSCRKANA